jgi:hypothetical protein
MSKSGILQKIRELFTEEETNVEIENFENEETKMEGEYKNEILAKLLDGTEVKILTKGDAVSIGDMVLVKSGEEFVKAPEGEHKLEGGLVVYVDAEGFINELETEETEEEKTETEEGNSEMEALFGMVEKMADMLTKLKDEVVGLKRVNQSLEERFEKFSKEPITESFAEQNKVKFTTFETKEDRIKFFSQRSK